MSLSPTKILLAPSATTTEAGSFGSVICRDMQIHDMLPSDTDVPMAVGHAGSVAPDCSIGEPVQLIMLEPTASHVTVLSTTVLPSITGHGGSVDAEVPGPTCTAS